MAGVGLPREPESGGLGLFVGHGAGVLVDDGGGGAAGVVGGAAGVRVAVVDGRLCPRAPPRARGPLLDLATRSLCPSILLLLLLLNVLLLLLLLCVVGGRH